MARLADHPYIVSVITAGRHGRGRPPLPGDALLPAARPRHAGARPTRWRSVDAVSTGIKLASAIETAHRSGILHRDIKPSNVLVTTYHEPALTDFGIAGHMADVEGDNDVRISYPWSPPELLDGRSNGSVASDVYSLGATIWHLLVGRSPFSIPSGDNSTRALSARILHAAPRRTQRPDVPPALDRLLQQCLAKQPGAPARQRPRAGPRAPADRVRRRVAAHRGRRGGRPPRRVGRPSADVSPARGAGTAEDATAMKPVTVISASGPRRIAAQDPAPRCQDGEDGAGRGAGPGVGRHRRRGARAAGRLPRARRRRREEDPGVGRPDRVADPVRRGPRRRSSRRLSLTGQPHAPRRRSSSGDPPVSVEAGDSFSWHRDDTDEYGSTRRRRLLVRTDEPVCLDVRMTRGSDNSPSASQCVS